ncbi:predicted protein [Naegleria gruberi]|uniref:Predicted protein n=1 Tax=Naegleria gruberi TaxID=5762 RepID=D2V492_NAEGR|nr:uncharacterized protein NAEGRDRAFT_46571 [Naegleria gruberi]EFC48341.1 predicted protein [Naegleria gruberi]|eukprot:XP_002681085.1 predicted protein [Naegleria gruberi strain NEG-M]
MKRKTTHHYVDRDYRPSAAAKKIKLRDEERPKRTSAIIANNIISKQAFIPRLKGDDLPEIDLSYVEMVSKIGFAPPSPPSPPPVEYENEEEEEEQEVEELNDCKPPSIVETKLMNNNNQKTQNIIAFIKNAKIKQEQLQTVKKLEEIQEINEKQEEELMKINEEMKELNEKDLFIIQLFQNIEREYEEKIKILTEKCFLLECKCNQLMMVNEREEKVDEECEKIVELDPIYEFGGLSPPSPPILETPIIIELTPPSPPSPQQIRNSLQEREEEGISNESDQMTPLSQETQYQEENEDDSTSDTTTQTPQKRRAGMILEDPMEMHINSSPSLSDTSSEVDFAWLFEQQLMPPPSSPFSSSPTLSTSSANDLASDSISNGSTSSGPRRSSRRGEKRQKIESVLNRLRTEMKVSVLLPNLILNEYVNSEIAKSESLEQSTPQRNSAKRSSLLSSEHVYTDRKLKLKDKSYVRTNYSYRGLELPENLIFFCK